MAQAEKRSVKASQPFMLNSTAMIRDLAAELDRDPALVPAPCGTTCAATAGTPSQSRSTSRPASWAGLGWADGRGRPARP
jgi:hypothetical protein